jgi:hypothetical protein
MEFNPQNAGFIPCTQGSWIEEHNTLGIQVIMGSSFVKGSDFLALRQEVVSERSCYWVTP